MLKPGHRTLLAVVALILSGCSASPENDVAKAAVRMNALNNPALDAARAEGRTLIVRYKPMPLGQFSDSEITKLTTAGLCTLDGVADLLAAGGRIRLELPRGGAYLGIDIDRCDGTKAITQAPAPSAPSAPSPTSTSEWPTAAPIAR